MEVGRTAEGPINSPLFNGNDCSMGGNGLPSPPLIFFETGLLSSPGDPILYLHRGIASGGFGKCKVPRAV